MYDNTDNNQYVTMVEQKPIKKCIKCNTTLPVISFYGHEAALPELGYRQVGFRDESPFEIFMPSILKYFFVYFIYSF